MRQDSSSASVSGSGPAAQGREFAWTSADFSRVQALIYKHAGISLHDGKHAMVYSRLSRRLRETGHNAKSAKQHLDAVAAQLILQAYFDTSDPFSEPAAHA